MSFHPLTLPLLRCRCSLQQYEVARCRPQLTADFFKQLDTMIGAERFAPDGGDEDRLGGALLLRCYVPL
jgi:hypothetical protein